MKAVVSTICSKQIKQDILERDEVPQEMTVDLNIEVCTYKVPERGSDRNSQDMFLFKEYKIALAIRTPKYEQSSWTGEDMYSHSTWPCEKNPKMEDGIEMCAKEGRS